MCQQSSACLSAELSVHMHAQRAHADRQRAVACTPDPQRAHACDKQVQRAPRRQTTGCPPAEAMLAIFLPQGLPALRREIGESTVEGLTAPVVTTKIMDVSGSRRSTLATLFDDTDTVIGECMVGQENHAAQQHDPGWADAARHELAARSRH